MIETRQDVKRLKRAVQALLADRKITLEEDGEPSDWLVGPRRWTSSAHRSALTGRSGDRTKPCSVRLDGEQYLKSATPTSGGGRAHQKWADWLARVGP